MPTTDAIQIYLDSTLTSVYTFPSSSQGNGGMQALSDELGFRANYAARTGAHGACNIGDRKLNARPVTIKGLISYRGSRDNYLEGLAALKYWCFTANENPGAYRLVIPQFNYRDSLWSPAQYYLIDSLISMMVTERADGVTADVELQFGIADPFAYAWRETQQVTGSLAVGVWNNWTITVTNKISGIGTYPVAPRVLVTVTAGKLLTLYIRNTTTATQNLYWGWAWKGISTPGNLEIDMLAGTCTITTNTGEELNGLRYLWTPAFYTVQDGANALTCKATGDAGTTFTVQHVWRNRWL
jgi:hypothetical protein